MCAVEVLYDQLRRLVEADSALQPSDVLVITPDLGVYAPLIDAVCGAGEGERTLPFSITDHTLHAESPVVNAYFTLFDLAASRYDVNLTIVTLARQDDLFIFDIGYFTINALARIADVNTYFFCRLNHQTTILEAVADRTAAVALAPFRATIESHLVQKPILIGTKERVTSRLIASQVPEAIVNARRRTSRQNAKK